MHSIYIWQLVWPVAAPLVMCMRGYTGDVANVRVLPYPAEDLDFVLLLNIRLRRSRHHECY